MVLFNKNEYGMDIISFSIGRFSFDWFTENGEWFIYLHLFGHRKTRVVCLSNAGSYCYTSEGPKHVKEKI